MSLQNAYTATRVIESLESYTKSDQIDESKLMVNDNNQNLHQYNSDYKFWSEILGDIEGKWNNKIILNEMTLSEQVPRVPGLAFHPKSDIFRTNLDSQIEYRKGEWIHYTPHGKSQKIFSGIGTLQLPPDVDDWRIASVSSQNNASEGIPILIHEEVWEHYNLTEGKRISKLTAKWRQMERSWSKRFPSMRGIPKGYLVIKKPEQLEVYDEVQPTIYHPFTIMEYEKAGSIFYDFVYVTVNSDEPNFRDKIRTFLGEYQYFEDRSGKYLIEPFVNNPLIAEQDVMYQSPQDLRKENEAANSHLNLIVDRINQVTFKQQTIDEIKIFIDNNLNIEDLKTCSDDILINTSSWLTGEKVGDQSANLLDECMDLNKMDELVDVLVIHGLQ